MTGGVALEGACRTHTDQDPLQVSQQRPDIVTGVGVDDAAALVDDFLDVERHRRPRALDARTRPAVAAALAQRDLERVRSYEVRDRELCTIVIRLVEGGVGGIRIVAENRVDPGGVDMAGSEVGGRFAGSDLARFDAQCPGERPQLLDGEPSATSLRGSELTRGEARRPGNLFAGQPQLLSSHVHPRSTANQRRDGNHSITVREALPSLSHPSSFRHVPGDLEGRYGGVSRSICRSGPRPASVAARPENSTELRNCSVSQSATSGTALWQARSVIGFVLCMAFVIGLAFGSFANVVIARLPQGESIMRPGSHCPQCNAPVRWYDNAPVVSWLVLRGRCRDCDWAIPARYPLVELAGGFVLLGIAALVAR